MYIYVYIYIYTERERDTHIKPLAVIGVKGEAGLRLRGLEAMGLALILLFFYVCSFSFGDSIRLRIL